MNAMVWAKIATVSDKYQRKKESIHPKEYGLNTKLVLRWSLCF